MEIRIHQSKTSLSGYIELLHKFYGSNPDFGYFNADVQKALEFSLSAMGMQIHFIKIADENQLLGQIALIISQDVPKHEAFFGFFECVDNKTAFSKLWKSLTDLSRDRNISLLKGPINGSIWHPYRVITQSTNEPSFPSEPITRSYYPNFFRNENPVREILYHSAFRTDFSLITEYTRQSYQEIMNSGIIINRGKKITPALLEQIFILSTLVFQNNWGYTALSKEAFLNLYSSDKIKTYLNDLYTVEQGDKLIGFCTNIKYANTLVMKTIAIDPGCQMMGLGKALVHRVHTDAIKEGIRKIIYALVRKENNIKYFPTDQVTVFREYSAFEYEV